MKKILSLFCISLTLVLSACSSNGIKNDEMIPYDAEKSLAYNAMMQVEAHYKIKEAERPENSEIRSTSTTGHLINTFLFSPNFIGSFGLSLMADDSFKADRYQLIFTVDISGAEKGKEREFVAKHIIDMGKQIDPSMEIYNINDGFGNSYNFSYRGPSCMARLEKSLEAVIAKDSYVEGNRERLEKGECYASFGFELVAPANPKIFPETTENFITVQYLPNIGAPIINDIHKIKPDSYI
jgi:hypothetical protein